MGKPIFEFHFTAPVATYRCRKVTNITRNVDTDLAQRASRAGECAITGSANTITRMVNRSHNSLFARCISNSLVGESVHTQKKRQYCFPNTGGSGGGRGKKKKQRPRRSTETAEYPSGQSIGLRCKSMAVFYHRCLTVDVSTTSKRPTKRPEELPDGRTLTSHRLYTTLMCSSNKNEKYSLK